MTDNQILPNVPINDPSGINENIRMLLKLLGSILKQRKYPILRNVPINDPSGLDENIRMLLKLLGSILEHKEYLNLDSQYLRDLCVIVATERTRALEDYKSLDEFFKALETALQ